MTSFVLNPAHQYARGDNSPAKTACVIGRGGFLGSAITGRLRSIGIDVKSHPTEDTKVLFHFGSHTHPDFEESPEYEIEEQLSSFARLLPYCREHGIIFCYPSSALVYEKDTEFARFKKLLEQLCSLYKTLSIGLRIFPVYGPTESRTVISKWCREMKAGKRPVVYGDGSQSRDFIFIDDVVDQILAIFDGGIWASRVVDIGTGTLTSFNSILAMINAQLGTSIEPEYIRPPFGYSEGIACQTPGKVKVTVEEGIRRILAPGMIDATDSSGTHFLKPVV